MREVCKHIPLDRLLIETDSPYLPPVPFRGQRNEPAHVRYVAEKVADLHGISTAELGQKSSQYARQLYKLPNSSL